MTARASRVQAKAKGEYKYPCADTDCLFGTDHAPALGRHTSTRHPELHKGPGKPRRKGLARAVARRRRARGQANVDALKLATDHTLPELLTMFGQAGDAIRRVVGDLVTENKLLKSDLLDRDAKLGKFRTLAEHIGQRKRSA